MRRCSIATQRAASPGRLGGRVARPQELAVAADCSEANIWWSIRACPLLSEADIAGSVASLDRAAYDPQRSSPDRNRADSQTGSILSRANGDRRSVASLNLLLQRPFHSTARTGMLTASEDPVRDVHLLGGGSCRRMRLRRQ